MQPYPNQDTERLTRVVNDICVLLHDDTEKTQANVKRWIVHVLNTAGFERRWWFLENIVTFDVTEGQDVIDLIGDVDKVQAVFCSSKLSWLSLEEITFLRHNAVDCSLNNAGKPKQYALEAGKRLHLWPAPSATYPVSVLYSRPMAIEIVPDSWEAIILNGVLGMYGQHFDRAALTQNPEEFERRFYQALRKQTDSHALKTSKTYHDTRHQENKLAITYYSSDQAVTSLAPASLTGIGYVSIELGNYPQGIPL